MTTIENYKAVAEQWRHIAALVQQATRDTDLLRIPIPQRLALGMAALLVFPEQIMEVAAAREKAGWTSVWDASEETSKPSSNEGCSAFIKHGPGHQSRTQCRIKGPHDIHEAVYGGDTFATWRGAEAITGFFDEPPESPDDE